MTNPQPLTPEQEQAVADEFDKLCEELAQRKETPQAADLTKEPEEQP